MSDLSETKVYLRITSTIYDAEITDLINAGLRDLEVAGIKTPLMSNVLVKRAVTIYVKANFGMNNPDYDKLIKSYDLLKSSLMLTQEFALYLVTFNVTPAIEGVEITFNNKYKQTLSTGVTSFYVREGYAYNYIIERTGYVAQSGELNVTADKSVNITLVAL